jgi:hypothetical protein
VSSTALADARDRSAKFMEMAATQHENRVTEITMKDRALAAAHAEEDEAHNARLDARVAKLERMGLQAGDSGSGQVEGEEPTEQVPIVSAGERERWVRGNALSARNVSFASLPVSQREQTDCSHMSSNPISQDVATMFTQLLGKVDGISTSQCISTSVTELKASQQGISASVMEVKTKMTQVVQFTHDQQNVNAHQNQINDEVQQQIHDVGIKLNRLTSSNPNQSLIPTYPVISGPSFPEPQTSPSYGRPSSLHPTLVKHHLHGLTSASHW